MLVPGARILPGLPGRGELGLGRIGQEGIDGRLDGLAGQERILERGLADLRIGADHGVGLGCGTGPSRGGRRTGDQKCGKRKRWNADHGRDPLSIW